MAASSEVVAAPRRRRGALRRLRRTTRGPRNALLAAGIRGFARLLGALPVPVALGAGRALGAAAHRLLHTQRALARRHLAMAFPDWPPARRRAVVAAMFRHAGCAFAELALWPRLRGSGYVDVEGAELLDAALAEGRGAIAITGHVGNWELLAAEMASRGYPVTVVARRVNDERFNALVGDMRRSVGLTVLDRDAPDFVRRIREELAQNRIVALLIDQDTRGAGVWVPFFGRPARTPPGAAVLALRARAPVVAVFIERRAPHGHRISFHPVDTGGFQGRDRVAELTARMTAAIEAQIRRNPVEWVWWHERWRRQA